MKIYIQFVENYIYNFAENVYTVLKKGGDKMATHYKEHPRNIAIYLRLSDLEFAKLCKIAEEKNLSRTEVIVQALNAFENNQQKKIATVPIKTKKQKNKISNEDFQKLHGEQNYKPENIYDVKIDRKNKTKTFTVEINPEDFS